MRRLAEFSELRSHLRTREDLILAGWRDADIRSALKRGRLRRLRRNAYMDEGVWSELWTESQHAAKVLAATGEMRGGSGVASYASALVAWRLPLYRHNPPAVELTLSHGMRMSSTAGVRRHHDELPAEDITMIDGIRCTTLERTVFDIARTMDQEVAVTCADAALRKVAMRGHDYDEDVVSAWRDRMRARALARPGMRGSKQALWVTEFADGRAQLPGESVSRLQLVRLGFARPSLQVPVAGPGGRPYWVDFGLDDVKAFGEFDGKGKYVDEAMRDGLSLEDVLLEEKQREDWIRGRTHRRFARWGNDHIGTPALLAARLAAFGIRPPD